MANIHTTPIIHEHPRTTADIRAARRKLSERERELQQEGAAIYAAMLKGTPPPRPLTEFEVRVRDEVKVLMNGATPPQLLKMGDASSRDDQIRAQLEAIKIIDRHLAKEEDIAREREAAQYVVDNDTKWRALCREIVLTAVKLQNLEESARQLLEPVAGGYGLPIAMPMTIGSGLSLLGIGDPLAEMRDEALKHSIVSKSEIRKATHNAA